MGYSKVGRLDSICRLCGSNYAQKTNNAPKHTHQDLDHTVYYHKVHKRNGDVVISSIV